MEEWKWIDGFVGIYQISNQGRLKSFKIKKDGRILLNNNAKGDYFRVVLCKDVRIRYTKIHELVAEAFIGERPLKHQIHHKDGNKQNNVVENLVYISTSAHRRETMILNPKSMDGIMNYNKNIKTKRILQYDLEGNFIAKYLNGKEASDSTGVCQRNILQVAGLDEYKPGKIRSQAGGFVWRFENKKEGD